MEGGVRCGVWGGGRCVCVLSPTLRATTNSVICACGPAQGFAKAHRPISYKHSALKHPSPFTHHSSPPYTLATIAQICPGNSTQHAASRSPSTPCTHKARTASPTPSSESRDGRGVDDEYEGGGRKTTTSTKGRAAMRRGRQWEMTPTMRWGSEGSCRVGTAGQAARRKKGRGRQRKRGETKRGDG